MTCHQEINPDQQLVIKRRELENVLEIIRSGRVDMGKQMLETIVQKAASEINAQQ